MPLLGFAVVVLLALAVYVVAERRSREPSPRVPALSSPPIRWHGGIVDETASAAERIALVGRLALIGDDRSVETLEHGLADEADLEVRQAIWRALLALRTHE